MSLKPQSIPPVPDHTASVARAAFPKGTIAIRLHDELGTDLPGRTVRDLVSPRGGSRRRRRGGWHWFQCCNFSKACPTGKRLTQCAAGSTGNTR